MKSDSVDYMLESHDEHPLTVAFFYDSKDLDDSICRYLCNRILDIYVLKKEKILAQGGNLQGLASNKSSTVAFESALPFILENVLIEFVKSAFIDIAAESMMVPWIYICFNNEFS